MLLLVTALLFAPAVRYGYVYEDHNDPTTFARLTPDLHSLSDIGTRMLTNLSFGVTHRWFANPATGDHLGNILLHLATVTLLFLLALETLPLSAAVALTAAFAVWPTQVETIAYVSARADLLVVLGTVLAFYGLATGNWFIVVSGWAAALLSKEIGMMAPLLTLLYGWWTDKPIGRAALALAALGCLGAVWQVQRLHLTHLSLGVVALHLTMWTRLLYVIPASLWSSSALSIVYDWAWVTPRVTAAVLAGWLAAAAIAQRSRTATFVLAFVLLAILPRLVVVDPEPLHVHHLMLASVGLVLGAGKALA